MIHHRMGRKHRRAAAAVEMSIVTPLLLTLVFGIIEYGWMFSVQQTLVTACREGARTASMPGSNTSEVQGRVQEYLAPLGLSGVSVTVTLDPQGNPTGEVKVSVPYSQVSLLGGYFGPTNFNLTAHSTMRKEGSAT
mgnify:CR=1 FL=1